MICEDKYPHITPITANEGKTQWGLKEDHFCDRKYHVMYDLSKRGDNSMLMQLRKLSTFVKFEMKQVSSIWQRFDFLLHFFFALTNIRLDWNWSTCQGRKFPSESWNENFFQIDMITILHMKKIHMGNFVT